VCSSDLKRPDYVDAWMKIIDWESATARFEAAAPK
jgi:superoxide dismutase